MTGMGSPAPGASDPSSERLLECQTSPKLHGACAIGTRDPAEVHVGDGQYGIVVILPVQHVENISSYLQPIARSKREALREGHMAGHAGWAAHHVVDVGARPKCRIRRAS